MIRLKITQSGWVNYTGWVGPVYFVDNVSTELVTERIAKQISACVTMEELIDDKGNSKPFGISNDMVEGRNLAVPERALAIPVEEADILAERQREAIAASLPTLKDFLTSKQLEEIADNQGIDGLRPIGAKWGVKDRSIPGLISKILAAQSSHPKAGDQAPAASDPDEIIEETAATSPAPPPNAIHVFDYPPGVRVVETNLVPMSPTLLVGEEAMAQAKE